MALQKDFKVKDTLNVGVSGLFGSGIRIGDGTTFPSATPAIDAWGPILSGGYDISEFFGDGVDNIKEGASTQGTIQFQTQNDAWTYDRTGLESDNIWQDVEVLGLQGYDSPTFTNLVLSGTSDVAYLSAASTLIIDPIKSGENKDGIGGTVRIKGDLYVDGETFTVNSTTVSLSDSIIELGQTETGTISALADVPGTGIGISAGSIAGASILYNTSGQWDINSSTNINGSLNVDGTSTLNIVTLSGGLTVTNDSGATIAGDTTITGTTTVNGDANIDGTSTLNIVTLSGGLAVTNDSGATIAGDTTITGTTTVNGDANIDGTSTLNVVTLSGGLTVTNDSGATIAGTTAINGDTTITGATVVNGGLDVDGSTTLNTVDVSGTAVFDDSITQNSGTSGSVSKVKTDVIRGTITDSATNWIEICDATAESFKAIAVARDSGDAEKSVFEVLGMPLLNGTDVNGTVYGQVDSNASDPYVISQNLSANVADGKIYLNVVRRSAGSNGTVTVHIDSMDV